ncbi:MAG: membrane integrity-associated transporter subunit PqiC [Kiritimatiellae bacterium]|nr:membrane integrity-associated transporter subunit PqiC [Kiritimatiellia bacterium]
MRAAASFLLIALCAGCFSSGRPESKRWTVEPAPAPAREQGPERPPPAFGMTRVGSIVVNAPFDRTPLVVRRADGSVAFDAYNEFAAAPSSLLRAPVRKMLASDGRFGHVVPPSSVASADASVEVMVTDLSLDCREAGKRKARAAVCVDVVKAGGGPRTVVLSADGASEADAAAGDFSAAFSRAFNEALAEALKVLK